MNSTNASSSNPSKKIKLTIISPRQLFVNISSDKDVTTTPSPTTTSSSPTPPNAPSKTPSSNHTSSSQENTSSSFQSKLQISPPSSKEPTSPQPLNPLLDNILDVPSRPSNPQPLQSFHNQPPGFVDNRYPHLVCLLQRSLYGLKQAPRAWQGSHVAYLLIYVDDIILTTSCPALLQRIIGSLNNEFDMTDLGAHNYFLGIYADRTPTGLFLSQKKYALQLLERAHMVTCNPSRTPIDTESKLGPEVVYVQDPTLYCSLAEGLQYLTFTHQDLSYAVQQICLYMHDPWEPHFAALKRCPSTRMSTSGYCVFLDDNILSWSDKRQHTISRSNAKAEYRGVANVVAETAWIRNLLSGHVRVLRLPYCLQYADIFTKGLPTALFEDFHSRNKQENNYPPIEHRFENNYSADRTSTVQQICLYMHDPREPHFVTLKRILRYVQGTMDFGLQFYASATTSLVGYTDADWAGCPSTRRSTSGYYIRNLLRELHSPLSTATLVYCDNVSVVYISANPVQHQRTKHIEIDIHFVRDMVTAGYVRVLHVPSHFQYAVIFTKGLPTALFEDFRYSLSVRHPPAQTAGVY
ncbi:ribonuclease H-like domain-containing protein [Tanacetum coccineum]